MATIKIIEATTPEQIGEVRELFCEYQRELGVDLCFQDFEHEVAGLPGDYGPPSGHLLLALAREAGHREMFLDTLPSMKAAQRLYVRLGFRDTDPYRFNPIAGSRFMTLRLVEREETRT